MYTRSFECTIKPEKKEEFSNAVSGELLPLLKKQAGFAELLCLVSSENPEHCFLITFWNSQSDADNFYQHNSPMVDIFTPYVKGHKVEHFYVDTSTPLKAASGKAA